VDFSDTTRTVEVDVKSTSALLRIVVPPDVDVTVDATVDAGDARVFSESWDGLGSSTSYRHRPR
jgi:predicted membrane protein